jgi:cytochrome c-type biogenesis protein CcmH
VPALVLAMGAFAASASGQTAGAQPSVERAAGGREAEQAPPGSAPSSDAAAADVATVVGPPRGRAVSGPALDARTEELAALLRCPVCQGLSVADSPSTMAVNMKRQVRALAAAGYDEDQVLAYFERSYGEFVRLEPPLRGVNWLVWLAPVLGLAAGLIVVTWTLRSRASAPAEPDSAAAAAAAPARVAAVEAPPLDDPELAPYILRVRELAYGWPGGIPPPAGEPGSSRAEAERGVPGAPKA